MYMSPEQARGETVELDARTDLYSAFAVLFELLTLRHDLRDTKSVMDVLVKVQEQGCPGVSEPIYAHEAQDAVPMELRHFVVRGLDLDQDARFGSAAEVLAELHRVRAGDFKVQCPVTLMKRGNSVMGRFMDTHPNGSIALGTTVMLIALGSVVGTITLLLMR